MGKEGRLAMPTGVSTGHMSGMRVLRQSGKCQVSEKGTFCHICSQSKWIKIGPSKYAVKQPIRYKTAEQQSTIRLKRLAVWHALGSLRSQALVRACSRGLLSIHKRNYRRS